MELIFKKYHHSCMQQEENYLFFDPSKNNSIFDQSLFKKLSDRNFAQNIVKLFVGPFMNENRPTFQIYSAEGIRQQSDPASELIANAYLHDNGYPLTDNCFSDEIKANGTIYFFPN